MQASVRMGSASASPAASAVSVKWASAPRRTTVPARVRPGPLGLGHSSMPLQARQADLRSPQVWMGACWATSVCLGAVRTCLECSAESVI